MPPGGILTVTVPGSLWGWQEVLTRFGTKTFQKMADFAGSLIGDEVGREGVDDDFAARDEHLTGVPIADLLAGMKPRSIGPAGMSGRVAAVSAAEWARQRSWNSGSVRSRRDRRMLCCLPS